MKKTNKLRLGKCLTENYVTNLQCENVTMKKKITISQLQLKIPGMKSSIKRQVLILIINQWLKGAQSVSIFFVLYFLRMFIIVGS